MAGRSTTLSIRVLVDAAQGAAELRQLGDSAGGIGDKFKGVLAAGAAFAGVTAFVASAADSASKLQQSMGGVEAVFKGSAGQIKQWGAQAADTIGLSQSAYQDLATLIGAQLKNAGTSMTDLAPKTNALIQQGADLAAMYGGTTAEAVGALSSALKGERDPIERYGISLTQAAIDAEIMAEGLDTSTSAAKQAATATATLALITKQSADAQGAAAREADSYASMQQRLAAVWENTMAQIGTALLPALTQLGTGFADLAPIIGAVLTPIANLLGAVLSLPGPILAVVAGMAAWVAFGPQLTSMIAALPAKLASAGGAMTAFTTVLKGASIAGLVVAGVQLLGAAIGDLASVSRGSAKDTEDYKAALDQLKSAYTESDASGQAAYEGLLKQSDAFTALQGAGMTAAQAWDILNGNVKAGNPEFAAANAAVVGLTSSQYDQVSAAQLANTEAQKQAGALRELKTAQDSAAIAAVASGTATAEQTAAVAKQAEEQRKANLEVAQAAAAHTAVKVALDSVKQAASDASTAIEFYVLQMNLANGINVSADQAAKLLNDTMRSTSAAFADAAANGGINTDALTSWNVAALTSTEQGSALYDSLTKAQSAYATSTVTAYQNAAAQGDTAAGMAAAGAAANSAYAAFVDMAIGAGMGRDQAEQLAAKLGIVQAQNIDPKTFELIAADQQADQAVADLQAAKIDPKTLDVNAQVAPAQADLSQLTSVNLENTVTADANTKPAEAQLNAMTSAQRTTTPVQALADVNQANATMQGFTSAQRSTSITVQADTGPAQGAITSLVNQNRVLTISVAANTQPAEHSINSIVNGSYTATVNVVANTSAATSAIAAVPRTVNVGPAPAVMTTAGEGPALTRAMAAPELVATGYPPIHRTGRTAQGSTEVAQGSMYVTVNVSGALDPDAVGRQIEQVLTRMQRRRGGVYVGRDQAVR